MRRERERKEMRDREREDEIRRLKEKTENLERAILDQVQVYN
jgi:hypothetical protein